MQSNLKIAMQAVLLYMSLHTRAKKIIHRLSFKSITASFPFQILEVNDNLPYKELQITIKQNH